MAAPQGSVLAVLSDVGSWHEADVQPLAVLGPLTGAQQTFAAECRFTVAFQTLRWHAAKVGS